jgi:hypothetical protein
MLPPDALEAAFGVMNRAVQPGGGRIARETDMKARLVSFGHLEIEGHAYAKDVVIDGGKIRKRDKGPSKAMMTSKWAHTPLTAAEEIPWGGKRLIVGTGAKGQLPIAADLREEAARRGIEIVAVPTEEACKLLKDVDPKNVHAILHVTC